MDQYLVFTTQTKCRQINQQSEIYYCTQGRNGITLNFKQKTKNHFIKTVSKLSTYF